MKSKFTFYSLLTLMLIAVGWLSNGEESAHFVSCWPLWYEPVLAGLVCGLLGALLGLYMLLNRIVFVSLAITQGAGLGIFLSFFVAGFWGLSLENSPLALMAGLLISGLTAFLFVSFRHRKQADEVLIGLIYVIASGLILFVGDRIPEGKHAIDNLLFGNAVAVTREALILLLEISGVIFALHFLFRREFLYVSADTDFMKISGLKTAPWLFLLYLTFTVGITISMKTIGSLPAFALMVIPPFLALKNARNPLEAVVMTLFIGAVIPPLGYYFSFLFSFPTGACLIVVGLIYTGAALTVGRLFPSS